MTGETFDVGPKIESWFHPETKQIIVSIDVIDVRQALASGDNLTVTEERAMELMRDHAETLDCAYQ